MSNMCLFGPAHSQLYLARKWPRTDNAAPRHSDWPAQCDEGTDSPPLCTGVTREPISDVHREPWEDHVGSVDVTRGDTRLALHQERDATIDLILGVDALAMHGHPFVEVV